VAVCFAPELLRGGDRREATDRTAKELDQPKTSTPSLFCFLLRSASPFVEPVTTVLLSRPEAQGEPSTPFTLLWNPAFEPRGKNGPCP
jgi:hypothetical protein